MRIDVERALQAEGVARAVQGSLLAVAALSALLALIGVLVSMLGSAEQALVSADLAGQGLGPRALRSELRLRALFTGVAGCLAGFVLALGADTAGRGSGPRGRSRRRSTAAAGRRHPMGRPRALVRDHARGPHSPRLQSACWARRDGTAGGA